MSAVKICQHGSADCAPLTRGEYGAVVVVPLLLPLLILAVSIYWRYQRAGDGAAPGRGRASAWATMRQASVARRRQGRGGKSSRGVTRTANQPNSSRNHGRNHGIALSDRGTRNASTPVAQQSFANPTAGGTLRMATTGSLRLRPAAAHAGSDASSSSAEAAEFVDDDIDDQYTTCQVRLTGEWTCPRCTYAGNGPLAPACGMCGLQKPPVEEVVVPPELSGASGSGADGGGSGGWRDFAGEEAEDEGKEGGRSIDSVPNGGVPSWLSPERANQTTV